MFGGPMWSGGNSMPGPSRLYPIPSRRPHLPEPQQQQQQRAVEKRARLVAQAPEANDLLKAEINELTKKIEPLLRLMNVKLSPADKDLKVAIYGPQRLEDGERKFSCEILEKAKVLYNGLMTMYEGQKREATGLMGDVARLWNEVEIEEDPGYSFSNADSGIIEGLKILKAKFLRCKQERDNRICKAVEAIRDELLEIWQWEHCGLSGEEIRSFAPLNDSSYTVKSLKLHQDELQRWQIYKKDADQILQKMRDREGMWKKLKALDAKTEDSGFVNRGGALLPDQAPRANIFKDLSELELELRSMVARFERDHNRKWQVRNEEIGTIIARDWQRYMAQEWPKQQTMRARNRHCVVAAIPNLPAVEPGSEWAMTVLKRECTTPPSPDIEQERPYFDFRAVD